MFVQSMRILEQYIKRQLRSIKNAVELIGQVTMAAKWKKKLKKVLLLCNYNYFPLPLPAVYTKS